MGFNFTPTGLVALPNSTAMFLDGNFNSIGGSASGAGNVIAFNQGYGIDALGGNNLVVGNTLSFNLADGLILDGSLGGNQIGSLTGFGNTITFNGSNGITVLSDGNAIESNLIFSNGGSGIAGSGTRTGVRSNTIFNNNGPALILNVLAPQVTSAVLQSNGTLTISGQYASRPNTRFTLDFYSSADSTFRNSAQTLLGSAQTQTNAAGLFTLSIPLPSGLPSGQPYINVIVTDGSDVSSRFSASLLTVRPLLLLVSPTTSTIGQNVTLTATVLDSLGNKLSSGTVTFMDGSKVLGTAPVVSGTATLSVPLLSATSHSLSAVYTPSDPSISLSTSSTVVFQVTNPIPGTNPTTAATTTVATLTNAATNLGVNVSQIDAVVSATSDFVSGAVLTALIEYSPENAQSRAIPTAFPESVSRLTSSNYGARGGEESEAGSWDRRRPAPPPGTATPRGNQTRSCRNCSTGRATWRPPRCRTFWTAPIWPPASSPALGRGRR